MKEIIIEKSESGIRLNKYLKKIFPKMPEPLIYKLIRKKYFKINNKKVAGNEILNGEDVLSIFLGDETYNKYYYKNEQRNENLIFDESYKQNFVYEDDNIIIFNKPTGLLSQGSNKNDESVNSILNVYLSVKNTDNQLFKPSIVNRLDRNTNGLIIFAKTYIAAREITDMIKENRIKKYYRAVVNGKLSGKAHLINLYRKDEKNNKAEIYDFDEKKLDSYDKVELYYSVISSSDKSSILDVDLITGKSHQIRAQFSYIGHPIVCDKKYMDYDLYKANVKDFGSSTQILTCYKVIFGTFSDERLSYLDNKEFQINFGE